MERRFADLQDREPFERFGHAVTRGVVVVMRIAVIRDDEVPIGVDVAARLQHLPQLVDCAPRVRHVLHHRAAEREIDAARQERQRLHVADDVDPAIEGQIHADDARIVERLPPGAEVEHHLRIAQRLDDDAVLPCGVAVAHAEVRLMLDQRAFRIREHDRHTAPDRIEARTRLAAQRIRAGAHDRTLAGGTGKQIEEVHACLTGEVLRQLCQGATFGGATKGSPARTPDQFSA